MAQNLNSPEPTTAKPARQGRKPKSDAKAAGIGHNQPEPLTEEELAALQTHHELKIRGQLRKVATAKAAHDLEKTEVNGLFKKASADLKVTRKELEDMIAKRDMTETEFLAAEAKRNALYRRAGLPVAQADLFPETLDTIDEQRLAYNDGFRAGRRADDPTPGKNVSPVLHTDWMRGWTDGQEKNVLELGIAEKVLAKMTPTPKAEDEEEDGEGDPAAVDEELDEAPRKLKRSGFMARTAETMAAAE